MLRGCAVECRICNREVAGSNLGLGYFAPRSTQLICSIPLGLVNEYQLRLGRQRQVWLIPTSDERVGVQVKLWNPLRTRAIGYLSASLAVIHYEEALYQVYAPLPLPLYTIYRMVPLSMTLSDLRPQFQGHDIFRRWISQKRHEIGPRAIVTIERQ